MKDLKNIFEFSELKELLNFVFIIYKIIGLEHYYSRLHALVLINLKIMKRGDYFKKLISENLKVNKSIFVQVSFRNFQVGHHNCLPLAIIYLIKDFDYKLNTSNE